jgi:hypothetical protein
MSLSRHARFGDLNMLAFMQEVPADGDDRVSKVNVAAYKGALTVESDELDRSVRYG